MMHMIIIIKEEIHLSINIDIIRVILKISVYINIVIVQIITVGNGGRLIVVYVISCVVLYVFVYYFIKIDIKIFIVKKFTN